MTDRPACRADMCASPTLRLDIILAVSEGWPPWPEPELGPGPGPAGGPAEAGREGVGLASPASTSPMLVRRPRAAEIFIALCGCRRDGEKWKQVLKGGMEEEGLGLGAGLKI